MRVRVRGAPSQLHGRPSAWSAILLAAQFHRHGSARRGTVGAGRASSTRPTDTTLVGSDGPRSPCICCASDAAQGSFCRVVLSNDEGRRCRTGAVDRRPASCGRRDQRGLLQHALTASRQELLKVAGELVSDIPVTKGAGPRFDSPPRGTTTIEFDQVSARESADFQSRRPRLAKSRSTEWIRPVSGGKLMLYTPRIPCGHRHRRQWHRVGAERPAAQSLPRSAGTWATHPFRETGDVLSYGGLDLPEDFSRRAAAGHRSDFSDDVWTTVHGSSTEPSRNWPITSSTATASWRVKGQVITEWSVEHFSADFPLTRQSADAHRRRSIRRHLAHLPSTAVSPNTGIGMTFDELQRLLRLACT